MGKHLSSAGKLKARLKRSQSSDYRRKGYQHIKGDGGRKLVYGNIAVIQNVLRTRATDTRDNGVVEKGSRLHAWRYTFTYGNNFQIGKSPYRNQGHHLLPEEAFFSFESDQLRMLQGVDYNINNGENIIFLPARRRDSEFHQLPFHQGRHPAYTKQVERDMEGVRDTLDKALKNDKKHKEWSPPEDLKDQLMNLQKKYWKMLVAAGPISINTFVKPAPKKGIARSRFR